MEGLRGPILKVVGTMEDPRIQLSGVSKSLSWLSQKGQWEVRLDGMRGQEGHCCTSQGETRLVVELREGQGVERGR